MATKKSTKHLGCGKKVCVSGKEGMLCGGVGSERRWGSGGKLELDCDAWRLDFSSK